MAETRLWHVVADRSSQGEPAIVAHLNSAGGKGTPISDASHVVRQRISRVARCKIGALQRVRDAIFGNRCIRRGKRLRGDFTTIDPCRYGWGAPDEPILAHRLEHETRR